MTKSRIFDESKLFYTVITKARNEAITRIAINPNFYTENKQLDHATTNVLSNIIDDVSVNVGFSKDKLQDISEDSKLKI